MSNSSILKKGLLGRVRRNHGLEHATLNLLARKFPGKPLAGHSNPGGFWIIGEIPTQALEETIQEALSRLKGGEHNLAIHPNCGTNFATAGILAGLSGAAAMLGVGPRKRDKLERLPMAMSLATLALMAARPLGLQMQEHLTTTGDPGDLQIVDIQPSQRGRLKAHRITTRN